MKDQKFKTRQTTIEGEYVPAYENTTAVNTESNHPIWSRGFLLRKLPGIDPLVPVQVFYDPQTGKICLNTIPPEFREELEQFSFSPEVIEPSIPNENEEPTSDTWGSPENEENDTNLDNGDFISWGDDENESYTPPNNQDQKFNWNE